MGKLFSKMRSQLFSGCLAIAIASFLQTDSWSDPGNVWITGVRSNSDEVGELCSKLPKCQVLPVLVKEFGNGNTFVILEKQVTHQDLILLLPGTLSPDELMEALIKVHTAKTEAARRIVVASRERLTSIRVLGQDGSRLQVPLRELFSVAGANFVSEKITEAPFKLTRLSPRSGVPSSNNSGIPVRRRAVLSIGHDSLAAEVATSLRLPLLKDVEVLRGNVELPQTQILIIASAAQPVNENIFRLIQTVRSLRRRGARVDLVIPYLPYARSDKVDQEGVTVTNRLVADLIERGGSSSVVFVRAHAPQSQGFFGAPTFQVSGRQTINTYLESIGVEHIEAPDAGAQKDATVYAKELGLPVGVINKARDPRTGLSRMHDRSGASIKGKVVAIVDDETGTGGTLAEAAALLKARGAKKVVGVVTHLAGDASKAVQSPDLDAIVVTNTFPVDQSISDKLIVLSIGKELVERVRPLLSDAADAAACGIFLLEK